MIKQKKRKIGNEKEKHAGAYLQSCGYEILEYNFYTRTGEIDIVAKDGEYFVFVEVKYRSTDVYGLPEEAVNYRKQSNMIRAAQYYFLKRQLAEDTPCRFDVVVFLGEKCKLIQDAFDVD